MEQDVTPRTKASAPAARRPRRLSREGQRRLVRLGYHAAGLFPLAWLLFDFWFGLLGPDPIRAMTLRTGKAAIILLSLSLACTPAGILFGWRNITAPRRAFGLYAFLYVCIHLLIFVGLDYGFWLSQIVAEISERRYALVGFSAFLLLVPLALTSTKGWQRRLGKRWKGLHKLVYAVGVLAVVHYVWLVKNAYAQPLLFATIIGALLLIRLPAIKRAILRARGRRG